MDRLFEVHMLNETGKQNAIALAKAFDWLLDETRRLCPEGREMSIVKRKLEEACFFAKKAMALNPQNQS